jgi:hypothetical protein
MATSRCAFAVVGRTVFCDLFLIGFELIPRDVCRYPILDEDAHIFRCQEPALEVERVYVFVHLVVAAHLCLLPTG